jgi:hypothetical protein
MAGNLSDYAENKILDHCLGTATWTKPTAVYLGLFTADPGEATGGTEVSGGSYARQAVAFDPSDGGATDNTSEIAFPVATADWGTIGWVVIFDNVTGGNRIWHGPLTATKTINTDDQFKMAAGALDVSID